MMRTAILTTFALLVANAATVRVGDTPLSITHVVGETDVRVIEITDSGSQPIKKVQWTITCSDPAKLKFLSAVKASTAPANQLPGGFSAALNPDGTVTAAYDHGTDALLTGTAGELSYQCVAPGTVTYTVVRCQAWNAAGVEMPMGAIAPDVLILTNRPGKSRVIQK